jgi:hypothetical protein
MAHGFSFFRKVKEENDFDDGEIPDGLAYHLLESGPRACFCFHRSWDQECRRIVTCDLVEETRGGGDLALRLENSLPSGAQRCEEGCGHGRWLDAEPSFQHRAAAAVDRKGL